MEIGKILSVVTNFELGYNGVIFFVIATIYILNVNLLKKKSVTVVFVMFALFIALAILRSNFDVGLFNVFSRLGNTGIVLVSFVFGHSVRLTDAEKAKFFENYIIGILLQVVFIGFMSFFRIGSTAYTESFVYGINHFQFYALSLFVILSPVIDKFVTDFSIVKRKHYRLLLLFTLMIVVASLMRTAWAIVVIGTVSYIVFSPFNKSSLVTSFSLVILVLVIVGVVLTSGIYQARSDRFSSDFNIEKEGRYVEYILVHEAINKNTTQLLFGSGELYNSVGKYDPGIFNNDDRPLHSTYSNIIFGTGYIGLLLLIIYLVMIYRRIHKAKKFRDYRYTIVNHAMFLSILIAFFSGNLTYGYGISFFVMSFFLMGNFTKKYV
ncbi:O-antigen ligase family protein [Roseivirga seohaensis]|uniref:O-antigen ligase family protein n=1 Tax=Roseivirga seohaensis TaxID=1914963 RepID=UPI003BAAC6F2